MKLILVVLDLNKKIKMEINISDYAMEEVLLMDCEDRQQKLVVYLSK